MLSEGTDTRSSLEIAAAFEFIGARLSAETRREITLLSTETLSKHWKRALELMSDVVRHPSFPPHELERVRREHLTDLRRAKDDAGFVAEQIMPGLVFGRGTQYGHSSIGTEDSVAALTREDLERHFQGLYGPQGATLVVAGDVTLEEVRQEATTAFGDWDNPGSSMAVAGNSAQPASDSTTIYLVDKPGAAQSVIQAGQATVPRSHPDYFRMVLLNYVFGGQFSARLNQNLRQDKGYSYGFHSSINWFHQPSALVASGSVQTGVTKESVVEILKEFRDIHGQRPITREELDSAQAGMLQGLPAGFERPGQIMGSLVQMVLHDLPNDYFRTVGQSLSAVKLGEANGAGQERIDADSLVILVVGDRAAIEAGLRELDLPMAILNDDGGPAA